MQGIVAYAVARIVALHGGNHSLDKRGDFCNFCLPYQSTKLKPTLSTVRWRL